MHKLKLSYVFKWRASCDCITNFVLFYTIVSNQYPPQTCSRHCFHSSVKISRQTVKYLISTFLSKSTVWSARPFDLLGSLLWSRPMRRRENKVLGGYGSDTRIVICSDIPRVTIIIYARDPSLYRSTWMKQTTQSEKAHIRYTASAVFKYWPEQRNWKCNKPWNNNNLDRSRNINNFFVWFYLEISMYNLGQICAAMSNIIVHQFHTSISYTSFQWNTAKLGWKATQISQMLES